MGLEAATLAAITAGTSVTSAAYGISQNIRQRKAQEQAKNVQKANNFQAQMEERRKQVREERIRRARIVQASENTGVQGSSGEAGALGGMSTQLGVNIGSNLSRIALGNEQTDLLQSAANAGSNAQIASFIGQVAPTGVNLANSIFSPDPDPLGTFMKQKRII